MHALLTIELALALVAAPPPVKVAALHYPSRDAADVDPVCASKDHVCAISVLVARAAGAGAKLVVMPEYAVSQSLPSPDPAPGPLEVEPTAPLLARFSGLARTHAIYLVAHLVTKRGKDRFNAQVTFGPAGDVVATHHKFELYGAEKDALRRGEDVTVVDTPFGRVGLLICADLYGDLRLHDKLTRTLGARIIAVSSMWTVPGATAWPRAFAADWGVYVVAANSAGGAGRGSGIFSPSGAVLSRSDGTEAEVLFADLPPQPRPGANR